MRTVEWSSKAERQLTAWIDHLVEVAGQETAERASNAARGRAAALARFSGYRPSRWPGYQEASLIAWHKIMVFRLGADRVFISAIYDMRQDLDRVRP